MKIISYKKLFEFASKYHNIHWCACYKMFINKGVLNYEGLTEFYYTDLCEDEAVYDIPYLIIKDFIQSECEYEDIKIKHQ